MSKKFINTPERAVDEALAGLVAVHPGLRLLEGYRVVLRADVHDVVQKGKVTILSGGGSGHEPAQAGYVGSGMLTAAVSGSVFASPPPTSILAALRAIRSPGGTLMIVTNYTGDRLNFGIAMERARLEGMAVTMVLVGEDCALPDSGTSAVGRRGLCGVVLVHKVAGALAEQGKCLQEVTSGAQNASDCIGTMSVCLSPCSVPGCRSTFNLKDNEIGIGLGVHGEAGAEQIEIQPVNTIVSRLLSQITSQDSGYQYLRVQPGEDIALLVNNLGGTSNLEVMIVTNAAISYLVDKLRVNVTCVYTGRFMTSLEMAGVSLTLLVIKDNWKDLLDYPTTAHGWPRVYSQRRLSD